MNEKIRKRIDQYLMSLFLVLETVIYFSFLALDIAGIFSVLSVWLKFGGIMLCLIYNLFQLIINLYYKKDWKKDRVFLITALSFTVLADICLLLKDKYFLGLCLFIIVQIIYFIRIELSCYHLITLKKTVISVMLWRFVISLAVYGIIMLFIYENDAIIAVVCFYFVSFLDNMRLLCIRKNRYIQMSNNYHDILFFYGMFLFLLCDINVGLYNLNDYVTFDKTLLVQFASVGMWLFYLPSQVLISISSSEIQVFQRNKG